MNEKITQFRELAIEKSTLIDSRHDDIYKANRADQLVWDMTRLAHELVEMEEELEAYYPEMIPFLHYLVRTYPALKGAA